tara:strand:+ start:246 stop:1145 length:900 start_codon:yes stop_codon:yes gene_type:complete
MTWAVTAALIAVGGSALNAKIARNTAVDPDTVTASAAGAGGSGGVPLNIEDIVGTEVSGEGITPFAYKPYDAAISEELTEDEIRAFLEEQGGVMSAASGRYLNRGTGGGITQELLDRLVSSNMPTGMEDMMQTAMQSREAAIANDQNSMLDRKPEQREGIMGIFDKVSSFAETNPKVFNAVLDVVTDAIKASGKRGDRRSTDSLDSRVMAGNANRRAAQINFKPIGAKHGGTLNRPMFMPDGGAMRGPGGPKEDLIPVMASDGEFMLSKAAVDQAGGGNHNKGIARLNAFNNQGNKRYG